MPRVTVIVPVYNAEKYLHRCIDSILAQTFTDFELLLVDDGSKDRSGAICDDYAAKDSRIRVFHKENGGVSSARNLGLDNAKGEWVTFCDSDDYVYPCWLENYNILEYGAKYDLICQGIETDKSLCQGVNKTIYGVDAEGNIIDIIESLCINLILGYTTVKAFRLDIINRSRIRFNQNLRFKEDETFVIQYARYSINSICVNKIGYLYYVPFWDKYKLTFESERFLYENLLAEIIKLGLNKKYRYFVNVREMLTDVYIKEFYTNPSSREQCLSGIRNILKIDYGGSHLFWITRFFIYIDPTMLISRFILSVHLKIKYGRLKNFNNCTSV